MMLTRCPICQTVFRLQSGQLQARDGEVRCGHCYTPFNALQHQIGARTLGNPTPATPPPAHTAFQAQADAFPLVNDPGAQREPPPPPRPPFPPQPALAPAAATPARAGHGPVTSADEPGAFARAHAPDPRHLDARYGRAPQAVSPLRRTLQTLTLGLLSGLLAAQGLYLMRTQISLTLPSLRPLLVAACKRLGCEVALPQKIGEISIASSDLQSDPAQNGRYILHALIRNHSDHLQAWPHLELTLTDGRDTPIARRAFTPLEWAPEAFRSDAMGAGATVTTRLALDIADLSPTGYRLYVFYP